MGWLRKAWRRAKNFVRAVVRAVVRIVVTIVTFVVKILDLIFGFLAWPQKKMRLQILVLKNSDAPGDYTLTDRSMMMPSIEKAIAILKDQCNIKLTAYSKGNKDPIDNWVQFIDDLPPGNALVGEKCNPWTIFTQEFKQAGAFFADHLAGWVGGIPTSGYFPITMFVIRDFKDPDLLGCSGGFWTEYITVKGSAFVDASGKPVELSTIAHEIAHTCNLLGHFDYKTNIQYPNEDRTAPYRFNWLQKSIVRSSRHATYY